MSNRYAMASRSTYSCVIYEESDGDFSKTSMHFDAGLMLNAMDSMRLYRDEEDMAL
jgi:hypothetical protein